jgi:predicted nucleic acid-binding Zn ribbon protein
LQCLLVTLAETWPHLARPLHGLNSELESLTMPVYVYGVVLSEVDDTIGETFEIEQGIKDPPLTSHPVTGQPVRRVMCAPFVAGTWSPLKSKRMLSDSNLEKKGITKYVKNSSGQYERRTGKGPDFLTSGSSD